MVAGYSEVADAALAVLHGLAEQVRGELSSAADAVGSGRFDHPSVAHSAAVSEAMCEAMITILRSAGLGAVVAADELRPFTIQISPSVATARR